MPTTMKVSTQTRDALARIARELGLTMDGAVAYLLRERQLWQDVHDLEQDPVVMAEQRAQWARIDAEPEVGADERDW